jgi:predicted DNA helicase
MKRLLLLEMEEEKKRTFREHVSGRVIDISDDIATVECAFSMFEEGDVVGYLNSPLRGIEPFGIVIAGGRLLTVRLFKPIPLEEDKPIELYEAEVLVGYDLQTELVDSIMAGRLDDLGKKAVQVIFEKVDLPKPSRAHLDDRRDLTGNFEFDDSQVEAVESILGLREGELLLIIGPPGTGKTRVIAKAAYEFFKRGERVLIASHTNRAVDNAIEILPVENTLRVGRPEKVLKNVRPYLLSYKARMALGSELEELENEIERDKKNLGELYNLKTEYYKIGLKEKYDSLKARIAHSKVRLKQLFEERNTMLSRESEKLVQDAMIVGSTLVKSQLRPLKNENFDVVLIDECGQASITLALLGMIKSKKWVLIGDHKQLLPIFKTKKEKLVQERLSAFCYLLEKYESRSLWLKWHYRCNSEIIGFSRRYFYEGKIAPVERCKEIKIELKRCPTEDFLYPDKPVVFLDVNGSDYVEADGSRCNPEEVEVVKRTVSGLKICGVCSDQIGVITPFRAQRNKIKEEIKDDAIEVGTVDAFQGREKDIVIFSVTSTQSPSFVEDPNRLNVAFTRARKKLIVLGNSRPIIKNGGLLAKFIEYAKERQGFYTINM